MSAAWARASPAMTGPWTSRAIARTAAKSPGEAMGNPASITSTPSRASWCAISSFSASFSEMPGDCSPSRSVVSKMMTRSGSMPCSSLGSFLLLGDGFAAAAAARASFPPKGEEKEEKGRARHAGTP